jgi:hypothetical protein
MIYTAPCVFDAGRYITWGSGGWLALEILSFVGPCEMVRADRRVQFGAQKTQDFQRQPPPTSPSNGSARIKKHYVRGRINHWCIPVGGFMNTRIT